MKKRGLLLAVAVTLLLGGIAYAAIPGPDGVIHGCYKNSTPAQGALIAIDSAASCPSGYTTLNWNQTGPQGPAGPAGANGVSGIESVFGTRTITAALAGTNAEAFANCPAGKKVVGGGGSLGQSMLTPRDQLFRFVGSFPGGGETNFDKNQWIFAVEVPSTFTGTDTIEADAICVVAN